MHPRMVVARRLSVVTTPKLMGFKVRGLCRVPHSTRNTKTRTKTTTIISGVGVKKHPDLMGFAVVHMHAAVVTG